MWAYWILLILVESLVLNIWVVMCSFFQEYRFDVSKLEPVVAKVCSRPRLLCVMNHAYFLIFLRIYFPSEVLWFSLSACMHSSQSMSATRSIDAGFWLDVLLWQPHSPDNRGLAREFKDVKIDRVYIGSCTGGKTEDFMAAAELLAISVSC